MLRSVGGYRGDGGGELRRGDIPRLRVWPRGLAIVDLPGEGIRGTIEAEEQALVEQLVARPAA